MSGITDPTEEYFKDGLWGWDGTQWRKQGLLFGYCSPLSQIKALTVTDAGSNYLTSDTVEANSLWIVQLIAVCDSLTTLTRIVIAVVRSGGYYITADVPGPEPDHWYTRTLNLLMITDDYINVSFYGCKVDDVIRLRMLGYKVGLT